MALIRIKDCCDAENSRGGLNSSAIVTKVKDRWRQSCNAFAMGLLNRILALLVAIFMLGAAGARAEDLSRFLANLDPATLVPGAEGFGAVRSDLPVAPVLGGGETVAWAFLTSDFVGTRAIPANRSTLWQRLTPMPC